MGLFDRLGSGGQNEQQRQITPEVIQREIVTIKANPLSYLQQRGYTVPDGMIDPKEITQHLLRTGQVGAPRLQQIMRMIGK